MRQLKISIKRAFLKKDITAQEAELVIVNKELIFQNAEKEKRAAELILANKELAFQNKEKENRAAELLIANKELEYQNNEKEKRAAELLASNKELESFSFISSHHLQEPLRKIQLFSDKILSQEVENLSLSAKKYLEKIQSAASHSQALLKGLLTYTNIKATGNQQIVQTRKIAEELVIDLQNKYSVQKVSVEITGSCELTVYPILFRQLLQQLLDNAAKFKIPGTQTHITVRITFLPAGTYIFRKFILHKDYCKISITDTGIGFDMVHKERIFEMYQMLNGINEFDGIGMGLTIAKKIAQLHNGSIEASGKINKGSSFEIYIPVSPHS